jgi:hypothetical protein
MKDSKNNKNMVFSRFQYVNSIKLLRWTVHEKVSFEELIIQPKHKHFYNSLTHQIYLQIQKKIYKNILLDIYFKKIIRRSFTDKSLAT